MKFLRRSSLMGATALLITTSAIGPVAIAASNSPRYHTGGSKPLPPELQAILDKAAPALSLGINTDWLKAANISEDQFVRAIGKAHDAVQAGITPGFVIHTDRIMPILMPIAVGYKMTMPDRRLLAYDTIYEVGELTGPLVTVPLLLRAVSANLVKLETTLGELFPAEALGNLRLVTAEQLLSHTTGFPANPGWGPKLGTATDPWPSLGELLPSPPPTASPTASPLNFFLMGLVLEKVHGEPLNALAKGLHPTGAEHQLASLVLDPSKRQNVAPRAYTPELGGFMNWGDPRDGWAAMRREGHGHGGLLISADEATLTPRLFLLLSLANRGTTSGQDDVYFRSMTAGTSTLDGSANISLGFQTGKFGEGSFGWDAPEGSSFWVLPDRTGYVVLLSNADHPNGIHPEYNKVRQEILSLLVDAIQPYAPSATGEANTKPEQTSDPAGIDTGPSGGNP